jgi:hypothetical protein
MSDESGRKGGRSYTGKYDTETKTARPTSVGPHHARDKQEDPSNPGLNPEKEYGHEIEVVDEAANHGSRTASGPVNIPVKGAPEDEDAKPRPEAPMEGMGKHSGGSSLPDE